MISKFFAYFKPHKKLFIIDLVSSFLIAVCNLFYPFVTRVIINDFVPNKLLTLMLVWGGALLLVYAVKAALTFIVNYWGHVLGVRIQADMRRKLFRHVETLPFSFFDENRTGTIMSRIVNDLFEVSELCHHGPEDTLMSVISIVGAIVMLALINDRGCVRAADGAVRRQNAGAHARRLRKEPRKDRGSQREHRIFRFGHPRFQSVHREPQRGRKVR